MFLDLDKKERTKIAVIDDSRECVTYGEICEFARRFAHALPQRSLIFILAENTIGSLLGFVGALSSGIVPLVISSKTEKTLYETLRDKYSPAYLWAPDELLPDLGYGSAGLSEAAA